MLNITNTSLKSDLLLLSINKVSGNYNISIAWLDLFQYVCVRACMCVCVRVCFCHPSVMSTGTGGGRGDTAVGGTRRLCLH